MPPRISWRDSYEIPSLTDVTITCRTDKACTCFIRLTSIEPQIHKHTAYRRGTWLIDDMYFCFVAYTDYPQIETGDVFFHMFVIPGWVYCQTKWYYFYGSVGGVFSRSNSPFFKYHNNLTVPKPTWAWLLTEPYSDYVPPPPYFHRLLLEDWGVTFPPVHLYRFETWGTMSPGYGILLTEPWTS